MGDVDAFSLPGLKCYFSSNDHFPQHFEVLKRGHWAIRVNILRSTKKRGLDWNYKYQWRGAVTVKDEQTLLDMVLTHKTRLLNEWNNKVSSARKDVKKNDQPKRKSSGADHG